MSGETTRGMTGRLPSFEAEAQAVAARLEQGVPPELYRRLSSYHDALCAAQAVVLAYQRQRAEAAADDGRRR